MSKRSKGRIREFSSNVPKLSPRIAAALRAEAALLRANLGALPYGWAARTARRLGVHRTTVWRAINGTHYAAEAVR